MTEAQHPQLLLLGRVRVSRDGVESDVGGPNQTLVLALLAAAAPDLVSADSLAESVWGDAAGSRSRTTLHVYVANLRKALNRPGDPDVIETVRPGYRFGWPVASVDVHRVLAAHRRAVASAREQDWAAVLPLVRPVRSTAADALAVGCAEVDALLPLRERTAEVRWQAAELELAALLALGRAEEVLGPARAALREQPLREQLWGHYMVALYRTGQQARALEAYGQARRLLGAELGLDPGPELRALESAILRQSASLDPPDPSGSSLTWWDRHGRLRSRRLEPLQAALVIGRDDDADVRIEGDGAVSRRHAQVSYADGTWWVEDLGSRNGTRWNAVPVHTAVALTDGDLVRVGGTSVVVRMGTRSRATTVPVGAETWLADAGGERSDG